VRTAVHALVLDWQRNWAVTPAAVSVDELARAQAQAAAWQLATADDGRALAGMDRAAMARLGGALAAVPTRVAADFNVALAVGAEALAALLSSLVGAASVLVEQDQAPAEVFTDRYGWICMEISVGDVRFHLLLDPVTCNRLDPQRRIAAPLESRTAALAGTAVALTATLELGSVDISLVSSLRPGDILGTGIPLSAPVALGAAGSPPLLTGRLTAIGQAKAITAEHIH
jgi:hypothetical protein